MNVHTLASIKAKATPAVTVAGQKQQRTTTKDTVTLTRGEATRVAQPQVAAQASGRPRAALAYSRYGERSLNMSALLALT